LIVSKLLAWDPAFRYPDATTVLADLDAFTSGEPDTRRNRNRR
jgi:hypothetical protein